MPWSTFNFREFVSTCKKWCCFINLFWRNSWLKNPAIWLAEIILIYSSRSWFSSRIFAHFPIFLCKKNFFQNNLFCSCTTSTGFLAPCQDSEKSNDLIPRKQQDRWQDKRLDRPYFIKPFQLMLGVQVNWHLKEIKSMMSV